MSSQGSAAEQQLRVSHQRPGAVQLGPQAGHHNHGCSHVPVSPAQAHTVPGHRSGADAGIPAAEAGSEGLMLPQPPAKRAGKETTRCSETNFTA